VLKLTAKKKKKNKENSFFSFLVISAPAKIHHHHDGLAFVYYAIWFAYIVCVFWIFILFLWQVLAKGE